jgi:hypothetical protein
MRLLRVICCTVGLLRGEVVARDLLHGGVVAR